jgi:hypothetical protein
MLHHIERMHSGTIAPYVRRAEAGVKLALRWQGWRVEHNERVRLEAINGDVKDRVLEYDFVVFAEHCVWIVEVDEHQHGFGNLFLDPVFLSRKRKHGVFENDGETQGDCLTNYEVSCEVARMEAAIAWLTADLSTKQDHRPIGTIRFNPDAFRVDGVLQCVDVEHREKRLVEFIATTRIQGGEIQYFYYSTHTVNGTNVVDVTRHKDYHHLAAQRCLSGIIN